VRKMKRKFNSSPMRKKPNMTLDTTWIRVRIVVISEGRATVAPARSSLRII